MKKTVTVFLSLMAALFLFFCIKQIPDQEEEKRFAATFLDVFDTRTEIVGYGSNEEEFMEKAELLKGKLTYYHQLFDIYNEYDGINNIKTINDQAGAAPVRVDKEIIALLQFSKEMYESSSGQVNIAMGSVLSIWHDYREKGIENPENASVPDMTALVQAADDTDLENVVIDETAETVFLTNPRMSLDVGGIGKGYAVQKTVEYARELGMKNLLLSVGGNVCAIGGKKDGTDWRIGIQNPDLSAEEKYVKKVEIKDACVVTSGNYQRYYMVDGKRYSHIIDPDTLMPAEHAVSVTIITADSGVADALSTAVYNMPLEEGMNYINSMENVEAMWILADGRIHYSRHFEEYMGE